MDLSEKNSPKHIADLGSSQRFEWLGDDDSFKILPHLNLDWKRVGDMYAKTGKPIVDLGASFSTLPTEGALRSIEIVPLDTMHERDKPTYSSKVFEQFNDWKLRAAYNGGLGQPTLPFGVQFRMGIEKPFDAYWEEVKKAIKVAESRYIAADIGKIPREDRSFSISIAHESVPKHSTSLEKFLDVELPEILRVTDTAAYMYPLAIYKTTRKHVPQGTYGSHKIGSRTVLDELVESVPMYQDTDILERIRVLAEARGFEFKVERAKEITTVPHEIKNDALTPRSESKVQLAVFTRRLE